MINNIFTNYKGKAALIILVIAAFLHQSGILSRRVILIKIEEVSIPSECRAGGLFSGGRFRSSIPKYDYFGYCGAIVTDHGAFTIIESGSYFIESMQREAIVTRLEVDCEFNVSFYGSASTPEMGEPLLIGRPLPIIYKINSKLTCK